ncbi:MAG: serpin family protein [Myxococcaceae bacterium]|nr:serpin family protein [Myxococcaceae bacterium]
MIRPLTRLLAAVVAFTFAACGTQGPAPTPAPGDEVKSDHARILTAAPTADVATAVHGNSQFALDLLHELGRDDENLFFSPQSITLALSMSMAGARNSTQTGFERTLHLGLAQGQYHRAMNDLDRQLESRGQGAKAADGKPFRLRQTNQLFSQKGGRFERPFLDLLADEYGAGGRLLDFRAAPEPSRVAINGWVADQTEQRIKELLGAGSITVDTRLVLVNAIYFNASWATQFQKNQTVDGTFHAPHGDRQVPLMHSSDVASRYGELDGAQVVELPYDGNELSLLAVLPRAGELAAFERSLDAAKLEALVGSLGAARVVLTLPSFKVDGTSVSLKGPLERLGLGTAFSGDADFSGITTEDKLHIADVIHQAFVKLDETGTEAAAATAVVFERDSVAEPGQLRTVTFDRPFVFLVRDNATGAVVFLGHLVAP